MLRDVNEPEQNGDIWFLSELPNPNSGKEHPMPFMDPCLQTCLGRGLWHHSALSEMWNECVLASVWKSLTYKFLLMDKTSFTLRVSITQLLVAVYTHWSCWSIWLWVLSCCSPLFILGNKSIFCDRGGDGWYLTHVCIDHLKLRSGSPLFSINTANRETPHLVLNGAYHLCCTSHTLLPWPCCFLPHSIPSTFN